MMKNMMNKVKRAVKNLRETGMAVVSAIAFSYMTRPVPVCASSSYTQPLDNLKTILITIAASAGVILVIYGAIRFAIAFQKMDQNGEHSAIYTIIAGGVLIGISAVLGVMGV